MVTFFDLVYGVMLGLTKLGVFTIRTDAAAHAAAGKGILETLIGHNYANGHGCTYHVERNKEVRELFFGEIAFTNAVHLYLSPVLPWTPQQNTNLTGVHIWGFVGDTATTENVVSKLQKFFCVESTPPENLDPPGSRGAK
jgi:hypothetical protein